MVELLNILVGGLAAGAVYGLLAVGFSLVFNVTGVLNLAQGAFVSIGALTMYSFHTSAHMPLVAAFLASAALITAATALVELLVIRPAVHRISHTNLLMLMGGMLTALEGAALLIWGSSPFTLSPFTGSKPLSVDGVFIATQDIWVWAVTAVTVIAVWLFLTKSRVGTGFRAVAENSRAARLMGISVDRAILISFGLSALLGVIAGAVIMPLTSLDFSSMATYTNLGLIAVTLGGLGSIFGAAVGGVVFGLIEAVVSGYISDLFGTAISLIVLIVMLIFRPQGLLGKVRGGRIDVAEVRGGRVVSPPRLKPSTNLVGGVLVCCVMAVLPFIVGQSGDMHAIDITGVFCLTIVGLQLLTGVAGQVSLGQAGFMAVGGYTSSVLIVKDHWPSLLAVVAGVIASMLVAAVLGLAGTRVRGMYLAIVTLSFGILVESIASGLSVTGGPSGIAGIPAFSIGGYGFGTDDRFYYLIWGLVGVSILLTGNLIRSNRGRMLRAMHADDIGTRSLGLNLFRTKVAVFVLSAAIASVAGSLYACYFHYLSPGMVGSATSLELITMLVVGGASTQFGPLLGVALLTYFPQVSQGLQNYSALVDGALLVAFLRYLPAGLYGGAVTAVRAVGARLSRSPGPDEVDLQLGQNALEAGAVSEHPVDLGATDRAAPVGTGRSSAREPAALSVKDVAKAFGGVQAVQGVTFEVAEGSISALIGPNGAGKSTLFNLVTNLYRPDEGKVELHGEDITDVRPDVIARRGLFRTFQTSRVFSGLTVLENVLIGGYRYESASYLSQCLLGRRSRREEADLVRRAKGILEVVGLEEVADMPAHVLPLAGQKYLDVARALMSHADVLLFDEPGAGMNDAETVELGALLLAVRDAGHSILVVDHNMTLVMGIADKVTVMDRGVVIADGAPASVQSDVAVVDAYFGRQEVSS
jgi:branched-chain amino acid transport system permease protein